MKKNKMMRAASFLLVAVLLTTSVISGTFAKYVSTVSGTDTARVAKWAFSVDDVDIDLTTVKTFEFDVFNTVYDTYGAPNQNDSDVKDGVDPEAIIAPGTYGYVTVALKNNSEVNATYTVAFTAEEEGVPLQWSVDGTVWENDVNALDITAETAIDMGEDADITLYWKWAFVDDDVVEQTDDDDTALGIAGTAQPTVKATVTITQVD